MEDIGLTQVSRNAGCKLHTLLRTLWSVIIVNEYASNVYYRETKLTSFLPILIFQSRFPDLNITEEDLVNAEKELEELTKENEDSEKQAEKTPNANIPEIIETLEEDKKDL